MTVHTDVATAIGLVCALAGFALGIFASRPPEGVPVQQLAAIARDGFTCMQTADGYVLKVLTR